MSKIQNDYQFYAHRAVKYSRYILYIIRIFACTANLRFIGGN